MQGGAWHDHETPKDFQPASKAGSSAIPEVESSGEHIGMRRQAGEKHKRTTPVGKGIKGIQKSRPSPARKGPRSAAAKRMRRAAKAR
jgi:hypothetical protein